MIKFTKMEGLGNDYVYIDCTKQDIENKSDLARFVSDRHFGIGSDGLILILPSKIADFRMQMYNADGSESQMCGNGIRCVGKFVYDKGLTDKTKITIETLAGIKILDLHVSEGRVETVRVDMGEPVLEPEKIPVISNEKIVKNLEIEVEDKNFKFTCVSMGNPHAIAVIDKLNEFKIEKYGPMIEENSSIFPEKTNVEFIEVVDENNINMRVWERGTGETLACGTGACATLVACVLNGYTRKKATIHLLGGNLEIEWNKDDNHVYMTGPARTVFEGEIDIKF